MTKPAAQDPTPQKSATEDPNPEPEVDHETVGIGAIGRPKTDEDTSTTR